MRFTKVQMPFVKLPLKINSGGWVSKAISLWRVEVPLSKFSFKPLDENHIGSAIKTHTDRHPITII